MKKYLIYSFGILICLGLGISSGLLTSQSFDWYHQLQKPSFNPPNWIFAPVWITLYFLMGLVLGHLLLYQTTIKIGAVFFLQLFCNIIWSPLFFYFHRIDWALVDIIILWVSLVAWYLLNQKQIFRSYLMLPYTIWVSYALILNAWIFFLN
jgi:translocator protein